MPTPSTHLTAVYQRQRQDRTGQDKTGRHITQEEHIDTDAMRFKTTYVRRDDHSTEISNSAVLCRCTVSQCISEIPDWQHSPD